MRTKLETLALCGVALIMIVIFGIICYVTAIEVTRPAPMPYEKAPPVHSITKDEQLRIDFHQAVLDRQLTDSAIDD